MASTRRPLVALSLAHLLAFGFVVMVGALTMALAQAPPEEELESKPVPRKKIETPEDGTGGKPAASASGPRPQDLAAAIEQAKQPVIKNLYRSLKVPHDRVLTRSDKLYEVAPLRPYIGDRPRDLADTEIKLQPFNKNWGLDKELTLSPNAINRVVAYEELAIEEVNTFLKDTRGHTTTTKGHLTDQEILEAAETALYCVENTHQRMRADKTREGPGWDEVLRKLRTRRLELRLGVLDQLADKRDWEGVAALARELAESFRKEEHALLNGKLQGYVKAGLKVSGNAEGQLQAMLQSLRTLEERFPDIQATAPLDERLSSEAAALFEKGKQQIEVEHKPDDGKAKLRQALQLWPRTPGLRDYLLKLDNNGVATILSVGVRSLPVHMLPGLAATDSERQAMELVLESLVVLRDDPLHGQHYAPQLASGAPRVVTLGREFYVPSDVYWSESKWVKKGTPVEVADLRTSVRLLKSPRYPGYQPAWAHLVDDVQQGADRRVPLTLTQGCLDPLQFMDFKILPRDLSSDKLVDFAREPTGTGPYEYKGRDRDGKGREFVRFMASSNYGSRAGKLGLPFIREIRFLVSTDPEDDFKKGVIDLATDVPSDKVKAVQALPGVKLLPPQPTRRVYFLAVNHRNTDLRNQDLRQALALAINREEILDKDFRQPGARDKVHKALRGPYPADSWAYEPREKPQASTPDVDVLYSVNKAKAHLENAKKEGVNEQQEFDLLYPEGDPAVKNAMEHVANQLKAIGLRIKPKPMAPTELRDAVEGKHAYQLAYYYHDYPSEAYWLWPLVDPDPDAREPGASNFLGYVPDSEVQSQFGVARSHRNFLDVKRATWLISDMLEKKMPLIPLWQLDRYIAHRNELRLSGAIDPLLIFTDVATWRKEAK